MSGMPAGIQLDQTNVPRRFRIAPLPPKTDAKTFGPTTVRRGRGGKKRARKTRRRHRK